MDDVNTSNGCLCYIDGSHHGEVVEHHRLDGEVDHLTPHDNDIDHDRQSQALVKKGGVVFHHSKTLHTSGPNKTDQWRRGFATHWVTQNVRGETPIYRTAYFHDPDYPKLS